MQQVKGQKIRLLLPLIIAGGLLAYTWGAILLQGIVANWRYITAIVLYTIIIFLLFRNRTRATLAPGIFFLLGIGNVVALTPYLSTARFFIGPVETPSFNGLSVLLFLLYIVLNLDVLLDIQIGYSEKRKAKREQQRGEGQV